MACRPHQPRRNSRFSVPSIRRSPHDRSHPGWSRAPRASLRAAPGSRRGKPAPPAWTDDHVVALGDPHDSLRIVCGNRVCRSSAAKVAAPPQPCLRDRFTVCADHVAHKSLAPQAPRGALLLLRSWQPVDSERDTDRRPRAPAARTAKREIGWSESSAASSVNAFSMLRGTTSVLSRGMDAASNQQLLAASA